MQSTKLRMFVGGAAALAVVVAAILWRSSLNDPAAPEAPATREAPEDLSGKFAGSASCRGCHEKFYTLWSTSHHGLAMQPFTPEFARTELTAQAEPITVEKHAYQVELDADSARVRQRGPDGEKTYAIRHVMGGKNVYYFLTDMDKGRLQVLPVSYDVRKKSWYDTAGSGVRHFHDGDEDAPVSSRDPAYTFNTSCFSCHVSQLTTNYDLEADTYHTVWAEPGINCETCHGPSAEHVAVCEAAGEGPAPKDLKILQYKDLTIEQVNTTCAPCHAKMMPITTTFRPGDAYFDHYDLVALEDPDHYPDGRDLGENYTYTSWRASPCVKSGQLSCTHCHTSSGRYRFAKKNPNAACLPCHQQRVANAAEHIHHPKGKGPTECISCHMPNTGFARMMRSDHSMRPPAPAATMQFKSPNACNLCHTKEEQDAKWADGHVRKWRKRDYQKPVLYRAGLIAAARKRDWTRLDEMLAYLTRPDRDEMTATGLIRLLGSCVDQRKWPALVKAMRDPSPLVRSSAASGLADRLTPEARDALLAATEDKTRLVRVRAASALAPLPRHLLAKRDKQRLQRATEELKQSLTCRQDDWASHYNMGNFLSSRGDPTGALASFSQASRLRPDAVPPHVNASMVYAGLRKYLQARESLETALKLAPDNAAVNFNLGLLLAQQGDPAGAEKCLRTALKTDPKMPGAAYNLAILVSKDRPAEAIALCRRAVKLRPNVPRYAYMLALLLDRKGDPEAEILLRNLVAADAPIPEAYDLLASIYAKRGLSDAVAAVYTRGVRNEKLPPQVRNRFGMLLKARPQR